MQKILAHLVVLCFCGLNGITAEFPQQIILPDNPSITEQTAAEELQTYLNLICQKDYPIIAESSVPDSQQGAVYVGATNYAAKLLEKEHPEPFSFDEIFLKADKGNLVLTGHSRRGALYAVYTFLEDICGCRWFTEDVSRIPSTHELTYPSELSISYAPKIISREVYNPYAQNSLFSARNKGNGSIDSQHGGRISILNGVHSFFNLIPPQKYFEEHPDWFSKIDGTRVGEGAQLCLTNDEMRKELTKNLLEQLRANPETTIVDVSQNDRFMFCTCETCRQVDEEEGSHAGTLIRFLNQVAADVEKEFPDVLVETLAYQYTRKPPKLVRPRNNILIRLCSIECDFARPFTDDANRDFMEDLAGWSRIANHLFIWDYVTNYEDFIGPHPNWDALAPNIRTLAEHNAIGLFEEGEGFDFCEMKNWVLMKLMWNPELDIRELMKDFCDTYYGKEATPFIINYWNVLLERARKSGVDVGCFYAHAWRWIDLTSLTEATLQLRQAEKAVQQAYGIDSPQFKHLQKSRLALDFVWLSYYGYWKAEAQRLGTPFEGPGDFKTAANLFSHLCLEYKVNPPSLGIGFSEGNNWFQEFSKGTFSLFPLPLDSGWEQTASEETVPPSLCLKGNKTREINLYTLEDYAPSEITADFMVVPEKDEADPAFGFIFGAENGERYSYIALTSDNVITASSSPANPTSETFHKPNPEKVKSREYQKWHTLHLIFHPGFITLYVDNASVYQGLPYPEPKSPNGKIGFFAENGNVMVRNVFFAGKKL